MEAFDDDILIAYILNELDDQQRLRVENWVAESEENRRHFEAVKSSWEESAKAFQKVSVNTDAAWVSVEQRIADQSNTRSEPKVIRMRSTLLRVAAVLLISFGSYTLYKQITAGPGDVQLTSASAQVQKTLSDGSDVTLNSESELSYPNEFEDDFRRVSFEGEAYFEIEPDKERPFVISTSLGHIKVLGTTFNVKARDGKMTRVQVIEGLVELAAEDPSTGDTSAVLLEAGALGFIDPNTRKVYKEQKGDPAALFWLNKSLVFNETPLSDVFNLLEDLYDVSLETNDPDLLNCSLNARFEDDDLSTIMEVITSTFDLTWAESEEHILISGTGSECSN